MWVVRWYYAIGKSEVPEGQPQGARAPSRTGVGTYAFLGASEPSSSTSSSTSCARKPILNLATRHEHDSVLLTCALWQPQRGSNPCLHLERVVS
jgi:hypothetical protein